MQLGFVLIVLCLTVWGTLAWDPIKDDPFPQANIKLFSFKEEKVYADWTPLDVEEILKVFRYDTTQGGQGRKISTFFLLSQSELFLFNPRPTFGTSFTKRIDETLKVPISINTTIVVSPYRQGAFKIINSKGIYSCNDIKNPCSFSTYDFGTWVSQAAYDYGGNIYVGSSNGLYFIDAVSSQVSKVNGIEYPVFTVAADRLTNSGHVAAGTSGRVYVFNGDDYWHYFLVPGIIDAMPQGLAYDIDGSLWIGNKICLNVMDRDLQLTRYGGLEGLPMANITSVAVSELNGNVLMGTYYGGVRHLAKAETGYPNQWRYLYGPRWQPTRNFGEKDQIVVDVAVGVDIKAGGKEQAEVCVMVGTTGISVIIYEWWTLAEKAEHYQAIGEARHNRYGLAASCGLKEWGNVSTWYQESNENEGLWTSMYLGGQIFRYAVTGEPAAKEDAWKRFLGLKMLNDVTGIKGLMARSFLHQSEAPPGQKNWHNSTSLPGFIWLGDTSSDEVVGHLFVYPLVIELLADTDAERKQAYDLLYDITHYIVENGFYLIDVTGKPTTWGRWAPKYLNNNQSWYDDRGGNSLQIISWLLSAYKVTGDKYFLAAYEELANKYGYGYNIINLRVTQPSDDNYSDHELAMLSYFVNLWTGSPESSEQVRLALQRSWSLERRSQNPFFNFMLGQSGIAGDDFDIEGAIWTLRNWPLSFVPWECDNRHRLDVRMNPNTGRFNNFQSVNLLPYNERSMTRWNTNPFNLQGGNAFGETDPGAWLLPYWTGRYFGFIN